MDTRLNTARGKALATGLMASTMLAGSVAVAHAEAAAAAASNDTSAVAEVIVTAQKREENLQKVSASIIALDTRTLTQRNVVDFQDYVKYLPSVSFQTTAPSATSIYMRGVASGENGNHSGPLPSVGLYLDEQSVTTIGGALDIHIYDVARIEALAGPQGTLYGASSESGTVRIITNKPSTAGLAAGYDVSGSGMDKGDGSYGAEGFVNVPLNDHAAVRLVGWAQHDGGYIDNVYGTRTFPSAAAALGTAAATINNSALVKKNFNPVDTIGGRAALKVDLNDTWTVNTSVIAQDQWQQGVFGYNPRIGDLKVQHFAPDQAHDRWYQASMTVTGKISKFDVTYTGGYFQRALDTQSDYTDYSYWYDKVDGSGAYWTDSTGTPLAHPSQHIFGTDRFDKSSHELRFASPKEDRLRFVGGVFQQRQSHWIIQDYKMPGFDPAQSVTGWKDTIWLTDQMRVDRDEAIFGQAAFDITDKLTITGGVRGYHYKNSLEGFFGFSSGYSSHTGESQCFNPTHFRNAPCINLNKTVSDSGSTYKVDLTYKFDDTKLVYATYATGYRPGGVNRRGSLPPYQADELTSYEIGWKTSWMERKLRFNGAIFAESWDQFQFSFLGLNSLTQIANAGQARIYGLEGDFAWVITPNFTLSGAGSYTDGQLTKPYCGVLATACPSASNPILAPKGQELPVTAKFKGNLTARYLFPIMGWDGHAQASAVYSESSWSELRTLQRGIIGQLPSYTMVDFAFGADKDGRSIELFIKNAFDERAELTRYAECTTEVCGGDPSTGVAHDRYAVPQRPRTFGIRFGQKF